MENIFYVYVLLDIRKPGLFSYRSSEFELCFEPFYVGKGKDDRIFAHDGEIVSKSLTRKANKIRKLFYETGQFPIKVKLFENLSEEQAFETEIFLIQQIGRLDHSRGPLTNSTDGGEGLSGCIFSEEHKKRISEALKGERNPSYGQHFSEERLRKMSFSQKGEKGSMFGKHHSNSVRRKIKEALLGRKLSEDHKRNLSSSHVGHKQSTETKRKISDALKNKRLDRLCLEQ